MSEVTGAYISYARLIPLHRHKILARESRVRGLAPSRCRHRYSVLASR